MYILFKYLLERKCQTKRKKLKLALIKLYISTFFSSKPKTLHKLASVFNCPELHNLVAINLHKLTLSSDLICLPSSIISVELFDCLFFQLQLPFFQNLQSFYMIETI